MLEERAVQRGLLVRILAVAQARINYAARDREAEAARLLRLGANGGLNEGEAQTQSTYPPGSLYLEVLSVSNNVWLAVHGLTNLG